MQMFKRVVSLLLTLVLLAGMVPPVSVRAEETEPAAVETTAETEAAPEETTAPAQESAAPTEVPTEGVTEPVQTVPGTTEAAVPTETETAETEAAETAPVETAPAETEATETVPAETVEENEASAEAAGAYSGTCGDDLTWELSDDGVLTISGTGPMYNYNWHNAPWYSVRGEITAISLEEGITTIGDYAFYSCDSLTEIVLPDSVTTIGGCAFWSCNSLTEIVIPDSVTTICDEAFCYCDSLTEIVIPASVTSIGYAAYASCGSLTGIWVDAANTAYASDACGVLFNKAMTTLIQAPGGLTGAYSVPESIITIGDVAFASCYSLTEIVIPDSVITIGDYAFDSCYNLTEIVILDGVTTIGAATFRHCSSLTQIVLPDSVTTIGDSAFEDCDSLTEIVLPDSVTTISYGAFAFCDSLTEIVLPDNVTTIGDDAFYECDSLTEIVIPDSVTTIGSSAFAYCDSLTEIYFEGSAPAFGDWVFIDTTATAYYPAGDPTWTADVMENYGGTITWVAREEATIIDSGTCGDNLTWELSDDGLLTISGTGPMTDYELLTAPWYSVREEITAVSLEEGITTIGIRAFYDCDSLTRIVLPDGVTTIGNSAFYDCDSLTQIELPDTVTTIGDYVFYDIDSLTQIELPESVTTIGGNAFRNCDGLTEIVIPASVTAIGSGAFVGCRSLTGIWVDAANTAYTSDTCGVLYDKTMTTLIKAPAGLTGAYSVPESITTIGDYAFHDCDSLTQIDLPDSVTGIGMFALSYCNNLITVDMGEGVTAIGDYAFSNCSSLTEIVIPASVTTIGKYAFSSCDNLADIYFEGSAPAFASTAFHQTTVTAYYPIGIPTWTTAVMQDYSGTITWVAWEKTAIIDSGTCGDNLTWELSDDGLLTISGTGPMVSYDWNEAPWYSIREEITAVSLEAGITTIGDCAFYDCRSLVEIVLPDSVTSIGDHAFYDCRLTEIVIPDSVTSIGVCAFYYCYDLAEIVIPAGVTTIGNYAFLDCDSLTGIWVDVANTAYTSDACGVLFNKAMTTLIQAPGDLTGAYSVPDRVTTIGDSAFEGCDSLTEIEIPDRVTTIGDSAFEHCYSLTQIYFEGNAPAFGESVFWDVTATAHYPASDPTWTKSVRTDYSGEITWKAYKPVVEIFSDGVNVSGGTLWIDLNQGGQSVTFSARTTPDYASDDYSWYYDTDLASVTVNRDGTVTVTSRGIPGEMTLTAGMEAYPAQTSVTIKFVALSVDSEEIEGEDPADINLFAGKSKTLKVYDQNTGKALTSKQIKWSMDPVYAPYATINAKGKLTAKKVVEKVRIEAIGTIIGSENTTITVKVDIFPAVTQVEILEGSRVVNGQTLTMDVDEKTRTFTVSAYPLDTAQEVTWSIGDKKSAYASYEIDGNVLTVSNPTGKAGTVTIKATVNVGSKKTVSFKLNFGNFAEKVEITNTEKTLVSGESLQLNAVVTPSDVTKTGVTWSLKNAADKAYATVSSKGVLKAKTVYGEKDVTVVAISKDSKKSAEYTVTILPEDAGMLIVKYDGRNVTKDTVNVDLNKTTSVVLTAENFGSGTTETVEWKSSKTSVATVENGTVTFLKAGTVSITAAAADGRKATVTIAAAKLASKVTITGASEVASGKAVTLKATVENAASGKVTWSIEKGSEYAKISSSGKLTAAKDITAAREVTVRATAKDGSGTYGEFTVTIRPVAQGVQIYSQQGGRTLFSVRSSDNWWVRSNTTLEWAMNESTTLQLFSRVYPYYGSNSEKNAIQGVDWKSSSSKIATVDEDGLVTCIKPGTVTITATAKDGSGKKVTFKLKVINKIQNLSMADQTVKGGKSLKLADLIVINPTDATYKTFDWEITGGNGAAYASINAKGVLKTKKVAAPMKVQMRATAQDGSEEFADFTVTINP